MLPEALHHAVEAPAAERSTVRSAATVDHEEPGVGARIDAGFLRRVHPGGGVDVAGAASCAASTSVSIAPAGVGRSCRAAASTARCPACSSEESTHRGQANASSCIFMPLP